MSNTTYRLTQFAKATGCSCKIPPAQLREILASSAVEHSFPDLLVGYASSDDAAVYALDESRALIATTDFFTPIVDEAFAFGRIAAANALSDVYAMGGQPLMALAILGWPVESLPASLAQEVIAGGRAACAGAGIPLAGGHSIVAAEPFFGLCVNGIVPRERLKRNDTAREGDLLFLTKPIGSGILSTARKRGLLPDEDYPALVEKLSRLNRIGARLGGMSGLHAMTDVTGFGLLGHLVEMAGGSGLTAMLHFGALPVMPGARELAAKQIVPDATYRNWNAYSSEAVLRPGLNMMEAFNLLSDPQTNGGLLMAVGSDAVSELQALLHSEGLEAFAQPIGRLVAKAEKTVIVEA
jgi:selenide,water dikinase